MVLINFKNATHLMWRNKEGKFRTMALYRRKNSLIEAIEEALEIVVGCRNARIIGPEEARKINEEGSGSLLDGSFP